MTVLKKVQQAVATLGFIGYLPYGPGTWGSAAGFLLVVLVKPTDLILACILLPVFVVGAITSHAAEEILGKDSGHIVIDEMAGYMVSVLFVPRTLVYNVSAFLLFRIFDIYKPPPIKMVEKHVPGGAGIMIDDVMAGIYANLCIQAWIYLSQGRIAT
jgi:phosphatidylglycerophosphatase A